MRKIRVGAVNYLNTKPLLHGIRNHQVREQIEIVEDYPARIADMLLSDEVDVGLVPVAILQNMEEWHIVGNYGIGCDGPVASVCIFSEVPIEEVTEIYLDYQSRTSAKLAQILVRDHWKVSPRILPSSGEDFREKIAGTTAALVIGDRALEQRERSKYIYDLGEAWKAHTGLPFLFAAWISKKPLPEEFELPFNEANANGVDSIGQLDLGRENGYDLLVYYQVNISYEIDERKKQALALFLEEAATLSGVR